MARRLAGLIIMLGLGCGGADDPSVQVLRADLIEPAGLGEELFATGVSEDGEVVIGEFFSLLIGGTRAFRWTEEDGAVDLGTLDSEPEPACDFIAPLDLSADGSVVVGATCSRAFRWTAAGGMEDLGEGLALSVSEDGSIVFGQGNGTMGGSDEFFAWTEAMGRQAIPALASRSGALFLAASTDASTLLIEDGGPILIRLGEEEVLPLLDGTAPFMSELSRDGSVAIGDVALGLPGAFEAVRWTEAGGFERLGFLPGDNQSGASALSADGSVIVGSSLLKDAGETTSRAFVWTEESGMTEFASIARRARLFIGSDLVGPFLERYQRGSAEAISGNGRFVVGRGVLPSGENEGFRLELR